MKFPSSRPKSLANGPIKSGQRFDQDQPFGYTESLKDLALLVVLQDAGYECIVAFERRRGPMTPKTSPTSSPELPNLVWLWEKASAVDRGVIQRLRDEKRNTALVCHLAQCLYEHLY